MSEFQQETELSFVSPLAEAESLVAEDVVVPKADRWLDKFLPVVWKGKTVLEHLVEICELSIGCITQ